MSATTLASPGTIGRSWTAFRTLLVAMAIVVLASLAFAAGRATVSSRPVRVPAPIVVSGSDASGISVCPILPHVC